MTEGIVQAYLTKLEQADKQPGVIIASFFSEIFEVPYAIENIVMFNKLVKLYGSHAVFQATLSAYEGGGNPQTIYGLIAYICKKQMEDRRAKINDLSDLVKQVDEKIAKERHLKIRSPFDE